MDCSGEYSFGSEEGCFTNGLPMDSDSQTFTLQAWKCARFCECHGCTREQDGNRSVIHPRSLFFQLLSQSHLFTKLDLTTLSELKSLGETFSQLKAGNDSHISGMVIPFIQPVLEIFTSAQTQYLDESSFANEIGERFKIIQLCTLNSLKQFYNNCGEH